MASEHDRRGALTDAQRELLRRAVREGYFRVPREVTLVQLATACDMSDRDASEQLTRGLDVLLRDAKLSEPPNNMESSPMSDQTSGKRSRERVPVDRLFDMLRHPSRRRILTTLADVPPRDGTAFTPEAFHTGDVDMGHFTTELYHAHLPKLAEAGYIEWDRATNTSYRGPNFEEIAPVLRLLTENEDELPGGWP